MNERTDDSAAGAPEGRPEDESKAGGRDPSGRGLNPSLRNRTETSHDTKRSSRPPSETASVQREEGRGWPMIWLAVTVVGVLFALYILFW